MAEFGAIPRGGRFTSVGKCNSKNQLSMRVGGGGGYKHGSGLDGNLLQNE